MKKQTLSLVKALFTMALTTSLFFGCQKEENFLFNNGGFNTNEDAIGQTAEDTLNWLSEQMEGMVFSEEWKNEQFNPDATVTATEELKVQLPFAKQETYVTADVIDGHYIVDGDIIVGTEAGMRHGHNRANARGTIHSNESFRWPGGVIPYQIQPGHPITGRIQEAIDSLNLRTNLTLTPRTNETDYIRFVIASGCSSWVGRQGGMQIINASSNCTVGNMIHETLHAAGIWHEQSRCDRDNFISIFWNNIQDGREGNFGKHCKSMSNPGVNDDKDGKDVGAYNYESIMHYGSYAFSKNNRRTILPKGFNKYQILTRAALIGQRGKISAGDIYAVARMYPVKSDTWYRIKFRHSQKVWHLTGNNRNIGTPIQQRTQSSYANHSQQFKFMPQADGSYRIINRWSGYSLEIKSGSNSNYQALRINKYWGGSHQKFLIEHASNDYFTIMVAHNKKAMQTKPENLGSGSTVHQYNLRKYSNQQVMFIR